LPRITSIITIQYESRSIGNTEVKTMKARHFLKSPNAAYCLIGFGLLLIALTSIVSVRTAANHPSDARDILTLMQTLKAFGYFGVFLVFFGIGHFYLTTRH
jgi:hypothetical protein